jgi:hypothetical protein
VSYVGLGSKIATAAIDHTGLNPGNFTNSFNVAVLGAKVAYYEIYTMTVTGVPVLATVTAFVGTRVRTSALLAGNSEWDPSQPILMTPTDELYLCWNFATGTPPTATVWLRYDPAIQPVPQGG